MPRRRKSGPNFWVVIAIGLAVVLVGAWLRNHPIATPVPTADLAAGFLAHKDRWGTKTGVDEDAKGIDIEHPTSATVADLVALDRPDDLPRRGGPGSNRFGPVEHTAYVIDAKLVRDKLEGDDDQDDHIVITDYAKPGPTMIVEIPDPRAVDPSSPWREQIAVARAKFDRLFHPTGRFSRQGAHIRITGIGFFDFLHGQSGVAPNGIELHPVLRIDVLD
jgi:hypothetical protein